MASYLITGAARGLGLALTQELIFRPSSEVGTVFAAARGESSALAELVKSSNGRVEWIKLEVTDEASVKQAAAEVEAKLAGKGLDVLINNAGISLLTPEGVKFMENLEQSFAVNVLGVHRVIQEFLPLLQQGKLKKAVTLSSTVGSITLAENFNYYPSPAYKISKAAVNALTVQYAIDHAKEGFSFMAISPGWLRTDLGTESADLSPEEGAKAVVDIIFKPNEETNGKFNNIFVKGYENVNGPNVYNGVNAPW